MTWSQAGFAGILAIFSVAAQLVRRIPFADATAVSWSMRKDFAWYITTLQSPPAPNAITDESFTYTPSGAPLPLDLTLVGVAVLIGLVAAAFAVGLKLQRDTEGLVVAVKQRIAGVAALVVCGLVGVATLAHLVFLITIIASGRVASATLEVRDGAAIYTSEMAAHRGGT